MVLGDGDGRFLARLLAGNATLTADAVDISPAMLGLLRAHCEVEAPGSAARLRTHLCDAMDFVAGLQTARYDLVVTHFFLDCFSQSDVERLTASIVDLLAPEGQWLVSDFRIPSGVMCLPVWIYIRSLYFAFRLITGLRVTRLPDHNSAFRQAGLRRVACHYSLAGMLTTELWAKSPGNDGWLRSAQS